MTTIYDFMPSGALKPATSTSISSSEVDDGTRRWIRMIDPQPQELQDQLGLLKVSEEVWLTLSKDDITSQVITHGLGIAMVLPIAAPKEARALILRAVCTSTTLITIEPQVLPHVDRLAAERAKDNSTDLTLAGLLIEVIESATSYAGHHYLRLRKKLEDLADAVESSPEEVLPDDLLAVRGQVARLTMLWDDQIHGFMELKRCHAFIPVTAEAHNLLRDLIADVSRGLKLLAHMESRLRDLRQHQQQSLQESTNRRLNMLAILSAIYMPATLIAGLYGMNFEYIPITTIHNGYFIIMGMMAFVVLGHFYYFYRHGWFK